MRWIAAMLGEQANRVSLSIATRQIAPLRCFGTSAALLAGLADESPQAVIIALRVESGDGVVPLVRTLRARHRNLPIVGLCRLSTAAGQLVIDLVRAGLNAIAFEGFDDVGAVLEAVIADARDDCMCTSVLDHLRNLIPARYRSAIVEDCIRLARTPLNVTTLAARHGMHRATLAAACRNALLCPPRQLIMWGKLLVAANLLDQERAGLEHIAYLVELSSGAALSNAFQRYVGHRPMALIDLCVFDQTKRAFIRCLNTYMHSKGGGGMSGA